MEEGHLPVMTDEVLETSSPRAGSLQIDATVGGGGHTERILEAASPDGRLLGLDADQGRPSPGSPGRLARFGDRLVLRRANFRELGTVAPEAGFGAVDGCLFDLGLSSYQLADRERGFGFRAGGRSTCASTRPAASRRPTCSRRSTPTELAALFRRYGEEPPAWRIAAAIVEARRSDPPIDTAEDLARSSSGSPPATRGRAAAPPRDPRVPGAPDRRQRGARRTPGRRCRRRRPPAARRPARRLVLPLARGPDRQAVLPGRAPRLHLPARGPGLRLRPVAPPSPRDPAHALTPTRAEVDANPRARSARFAPPSASPPDRPRRTDDPSPTPTPSRPPHPPARGPGPVPRQEESREQAPSGQPSQDLRPPPARAARAPPHASATSPVRWTRTTTRRSMRHADRFAFLDPRTPRLRYAIGDWGWPSTRVRASARSSCRAGPGSTSLPDPVAAARRDPRRGPRAAAVRLVGMLLGAIVGRLRRRVLLAAQDIRVSATGYEVDRLATAARLEARGQDLRTS